KNASVVRRPWSLVSIYFQPYEILFSCFWVLLYAQISEPSWLELMSLPVFHFLYSYTISKPEIITSVKNRSYLWDSDEAVSVWVDTQLGKESSFQSPTDSQEDTAAASTSHLQECLQELKRDVAITKAKNLVKDFPEISMQMITHIIRGMSPSQRAETLKALTNVELLQASQADPTTPDLPEASTN
ncbi:unnamed protein product, partial [Meganyctiphanes norvegica]